MANLIVEHGNRRSLLQIGGRVSIGRDLENRVVIAEAGVLPVQAYIHADEQSYVLQDLSGGKATRVNGEAVHDRRPLCHGDKISIGTAKLVFQAESGDHALPRNGEPTPSGWMDDREQETIVTFHCQCGARLRARVALAGRHGKCKRCGQRMLIPYHSDYSGAAPATRQVSTKRRSEVVAGEAVGEICGICQCPIEAHDEVTVCSACGLPFHQECWDENLGCAAYGCRNVNVLKQNPDVTVVRPPGVLPPSPARTPLQPSSTTGEDIPWEFILLAASALAAIMAMVTFGLPAVAVAAVAGLYAANASQPRISVLWAVWGLSGVAALAGLYLSALLWFS